MKALILNNKVVDISENEFEVYSSMTWVNCDESVKVGFSYNGNSFTSNELTADEISERIELTNKKASGKQKLLDLGLSEEEVKALIGV
tara:strand:- start:591 stop:854 length:264 start_codon:yes stop_codon:yes gene_type:complete